ncbi:hypothetical protein Taro_012571 [Colocasia esculenta]|uniref:Helicase-like transcription factor CHR28 n=1 Tax=Colocasia esculenta TaxID=4460 RepID=A0A843UD40_COLES|nr:hypothetical protein [Colocasia esculenta]
MPPAGLTDTRSDVGAEGDVADPSRPWISDEDNDTGDLLALGGCDLNADDNLSIDFDNLCAFLDSEPPIPPSIQEDVLQANQTEGSFSHEKASPPQYGVSEASFGLPLEGEEHEHSQCTSSRDLDASNFEEGNDSMSPSEASKCRKSFGTSMSPTSNWLSLSTSGYKNSLADSVGCFEYQRLQTQSPETLSSEISVHNSIHGSQHAEPVNNVNLGCNSRQESVQEDGDSLEVTVVSCKDKRSFLSPNHLQQSHAAGFSYFKSVDSCNFGSVHNGVCTNAMLNAARQENNTFSVALDSSNDSDSLQVCFSTKCANENNIHPADHSKISLADPHLFVQNKKQRIAEKDNLLTVPQKQFHFAKGVSQVLPIDVSGHSTDVDVDLDICIIKDISNANYPPRPFVAKKSCVVPPPRGFTDPYYPRTSSSRCQADDEKLTFQIALQDLAQPKSEASPPEGVLAVPLLRHQRIALSWMVQKETHNLQCSGGILADDQGLGKTVSTIALILKERSPSSKSSTIPNKGEFEALNLDEDDEFCKSNYLNQVHPNMLITKVPLKSENVPVRQKGRLAAGTLVVCPTSVLRQWADELRNKVTSEANLTFLVYHGSNRTRDPLELVKYDVVLTTYSIVSMEVPVRSAVDKSDGKGRPETMGTSLDSSAAKKRKDSSRNSKGVNIVDSSLLESTARPLARVGWFRVILDEAQTIKNHRTQVARACWGLRAKRRWCLSGTPIQNAVDDLYSYFRFLKHDPLSVYNSFCSRIKVPIHRDPAIGYRKLQAVLKTVMLRRTKGMLIDGKPIINLPPKTIVLKKVDFSVEERAFYSRLEAESREKFKGYAEAGTVKQNYVNILLMLLRLRQACDHPLLVKGYDSSSVWRSSLEAANKIPRDKQIALLNSLETCLALCSICNDPPEDAVVAVCGHVYCNQCISEHLTGDDNFCPSANCKIKLSAGASVFSKATLESCVLGLPLHDCPEVSEVTELVEANMSSDSSKIKAALEILQSLPTYNDSSSRSGYCMADDTCNSSTKIASVTASDLCSNDKNVCPNSAKCSNASVSEKAIVYSQWTRMLDLLEVRLKRLSIQYRRLDGTMTVVARDKAVKDFNTLPEVTVMIMSLKAASLGLNMVSACHVLLLDLWWNPTTEDQAIDRAHRIGQTRPVTVSRLTVENTVEDRILALQDKKREMVASAFGEDESGSHQTRLTVEDLRYLFRV